MKKSVRDERNELLEKSKALQQLASACGGDKGYELRDKQNVIYNKWLFFDKVIKTIERKKK